jgi:hypothetical protein
MPCDTRLLDRLRRAALLRAEGASDPRTRQRYAALAQSHADNANRLRATGGVTHWLSIAAWTGWQPTSLLITNDP